MAVKVAAKKSSGGGTVPLLDALGVTPTLNAIGGALGDVVKGIQGYAQGVNNSPLKFLGSGDLGLANNFINNTATPIVPPKTTTPNTQASSVTGNPFSDYLNAAQGMLGNGLTSAYNNEVNTTVNNAQNENATIAGVYSALANQYAQQAPGIQSNYQAANAADNAATTDAENTTQGAYSAAQNQANQALSALGIAPAAQANTAAQGNYAANQNARFISDLASNGAANQANNNTDLAAALQYNTGMGQAAQLGGAQAQSTLAQNVAKELANMASTYETQLQSQIPTDFTIADDLQKNDPNSLESQIAAAQQNFTNQLNAQKVANSAPVNLSQAIAAYQKATGQSLGSATTGAGDALRALLSDKS